MSVNVEVGAWECKHCGWKDGLRRNQNHFQHSQTAQPKTYSRPAPVKLSDKGIAAAIKYLAGRGISEKTVYDNHITVGWYLQVKQTLQFPYYKHDELVNVKHQDTQKQRNMEKGAELCLYRFDKIIRRSPSDPLTLVITEGEIDCLSCVEAGFVATSVPNGAPPPNATNFDNHFRYLESAEQILKAYDRIILAGDNDAPGAKLTGELARRLGVERCYTVKWPDDCKDANDVLVKYGKDTLRECLQNREPYPIIGLEDLRVTAREMRQIYRSGGTPLFSTGWKTLDKYYKVAPGDLTVITGIPGAGKSEFIENLAVNLARHDGWKFAFFSPENWPLENFYMRMIEKVERRPVLCDGDHCRRMTEQEFEAAMDMIYPFFLSIVLMDDSLSVDRILELAKSAVYRNGIKGLIIDPWNEVEHLYQNMTEAQYLSNSLGKIKKFAKLSGVHVWIIAHPRTIQKNSSGEYPPPTMYEISGGAHWRNKADNGLCVYREDYHNRMSKIFVQKIRYRSRGKIGDVELEYDTDCGVFTEKAVYEQQPLY